MDRRRIFKEICGISILGPSVSCSIRLVPMECFILLFPIMSCQLNHSETTNETTSTMYGFIFKFHSTKFYFVSLVLMTKFERNMLY
jgi:hypothetical protein